MPVIAASSIQEPVTLISAVNVALVDDLGNIANYHAGSEYTQYLLTQILYQLSRIADQLSDTSL